MSSEIPIDDGFWVSGFWPDGYWPDGYWPDCGTFTLYERSGIVGVQKIRRASRDAIVDKVSGVQKIRYAS